MTGTADRRPRSSEDGVVGGPGDFMTVHRLAVAGTNFDIGRVVGELAIERYGQRAEHYLGNARFVRARRAYFQRHYPIHWQRMQGVASAFGVHPEDDRFDLSNVVYNADIPMPPPLGCSAVYFPPATTASRHGYLSRNYDFSVGPMAGIAHPPVSPDRVAELPPVMSEPYVMEWLPTDASYRSIAIHAFDLLSGTLDGMNETGLVVSILADDEAIARLGPSLESHLGVARAVGVHEMQLMTLLLDTCADVDEAQATLLAVKDFYYFAPVHYIVADRTGRSFVYEHSTGRNVQHVIDGDGEPQVVTDFALYRHQNEDPLFAAPPTPETNAFWRYRALSDRIAGHGGSFSLDDLRGLSDAVSFPGLLARDLDEEGLVPDSGDGAANTRVGTLWHSLYDQAANTLTVRFYLGEGTQPGGPQTVRRSDDVTFALGAAWRRGSLVRPTQPHRSTAGDTGAASPRRQDASASANCNHARTDPSPCRELGGASASWPASTVPGGHSERSLTAILARTRRDSRNNRLQGDRGVAQL
jgi:hypothetical protein